MSTDHNLISAWYLAGVFTAPEASPEFVAAWQRKVIRLMAILGRARSQSGDIAERKERVAYRLLNTLLRQRDAIQARALTSRR
jgi:hypothetical protein